MRVPLATVDASPDFVTEALREGGALAADARAVCVEHEQLAEGVGFVGQLARLRLSYEPADAGPASLILKIPSAQPENRAVADFFNFSEIEGRFYEHLAGKVGVRTPRCYWSQTDPAGNSFGLLLEDLGAARSVNQINGADVAVVSRLVDVLAQLHGAFWDSPVLDGLEWVPPGDSETRLAAGTQYRQGWPIFLERWGTALSERERAVGLRVGAALEKVFIESATDAPRTLCHGDFRLDNLLFDDTADDLDHVVVLDWQILYRGPGVSDVAYLLCQSMDEALRAAHERDLVRRWYDGVVAARGGRPGDEIEKYPFSLAWRHYRRAALVMVLFPVIGGATMDVANDRGVELINVMIHRAFSAACHLDGDGILPA